MGKGKMQVETSRKRLTKLKNDGMELVTNVRVAGDAREMQHRLEDAESKHARFVVYFLGSHYKSKLELKSNLNVAKKFSSLFISYLFCAESQSVRLSWSNWQNFVQV